MDMKAKSDQRRERLNYSIRREKIDRLLKQRRKLIVSAANSSSQLQELHSMLVHSNVTDLNRYLQLLTDELHKDIESSLKVLLLDFLRFAIGQLERIEFCDNQLLLIEVISLVCYELPSVEPYSKRIIDIILKLMFCEDQITRSKCLLALTNLSFSDDETVIRHVYESEVLDNVMCLLEDYPVSDPEKQHILGLFGNLSLHPRPQLFGCIQLLDNISTEVQNEELLQQLTVLCSYILDQFGEEQTLKCDQYISTIHNLMSAYASTERLHRGQFRLLRKVFSKLDGSTKCDFIERGITMLIYQALTSQSSTSTRIEVIGLLYECFSEESINFLTHLEDVSKYVSQLMKCFFEESKLRFYVLKALNQAVNNIRLMAEIVVEDEQFKQTLQEYCPTEAENDVVYQLLELLEKLLKEEPVQYLRKCTRRICQTTYCNSNESIASLSEKLLRIIDVK